jgi:uncharacterized protein (DUF983 family)
MEKIITLGILLAAMAVIALMVWMENRRRESLDTSLVPTTPIMLIAGLAVLLSLVHLLNLFGIHTGR